MRSSLIVAAAAAIVSFSLAAQTTGRIVGTVLDTAGKPVPNAVMTIRRVDLGGSSTIKIDSKGSFIQVGLGPYEHELTVTAEGFVGHKEVVKIIVGDQVVKNIVLMTPAEAGQGAAENPANVKANLGIDDYNQAVAFLNAKNYQEAMGKLESVVAAFREALESGVSAEAKPELEKNLGITVGLLSVSQYELGKADRDRRNELWLLAEPGLKDTLEKGAQTSDRAFAAQALADIASMKGDKNAETMYLDTLEKILGPQGETSYNRAVDLYNSGNLGEAKVHLKKAIEINPKLSEPYYLLAICEYSDGNMRGAKSMLEKYLQLDPKGKYADAVKEMLTDPSFK